MEPELPVGGLTAALGGFGGHGAEQRQPVHPQPFELFENGRGDALHRQPGRRRHRQNIRLGDLPGQAHGNGALHNLIEQPRIGPLKQPLLHHIGAAEHQPAARAVVSFADNLHHPARLRARGRNHQLVQLIDNEQRARVERAQKGWGVLRVNSGRVHTKVGAGFDCFGMVVEVVEVGVQKCIGCELACCNGCVIINGHGLDSIEVFLFATFNAWR